MQKIVPCLWFDTEAEEAVNFYCSVFKDSEILDITYYGEAGPRPAGLVMTVRFRLQGQEFVALNAGPQCKFTEAISLMVNCDTQEEIDMMWDKLSAGGEEVECGWLKDKYGLSWQIAPTIWPQLMGGPDPARSQNAMRAMGQMKKLDIATLKKAYEQ